MNAEAWRIYQALGSRIAGVCHLRGVILDRWTDGWPAEDVIDLLQRLDVIADVLDPRQP